MVDPFGTVFAARGGAATPIPGAQIEILADQIGNPLAIPAGVGFPPNLQNDNPFRSDNNGHFSFALSPEQLGTQSTPAQYFLKATAAGFSTRMLVITLCTDDASFYLLSELVEHAEHHQHRFLALREHFLEVLLRRGELLLGLLLGFAEGLELGGDLCHECQRQRPVACFVQLRQRNRSTRNWLGAGNSN